MAQRCVATNGRLSWHLHQRSNQKSLIEEGAASEHIISHNVYPERPTIDARSWKMIVSYYVERAPQRLPPLQKIAVAPSSIFTAVRPQFTLRPPSSTFAHINDETGDVTLGDAVSGTVYSLSPQLGEVRRDSTGETPVWVTWQSDGRMVAIMGSFSPTDAPSGRVVFIPLDRSKPLRTIIGALQRPIHHSVADLDSDGDMDLVVCEFGKWTGGLSMWRNNGATYDRIELRSGPGATRTEIRDWNNDGRPDILALFAQGNEELVVFLNMGTGTFEEQNILRFPPSWGSSFFTVDDVDSEFLPMHGAYGAISCDFDLDGDIDIAAISFFPDYSEVPVRGFMLFENTGNRTYRANTFPEVGSGRWIVMDSGDIDRNGDRDLILGSLAFEVPGKDNFVQGWVKNAMPFVILENRTK